MLWRTPTYEWELWGAGGIKNKKGDIDWLCAAKRQYKGEDSSMTYVIWKFEILKVSLSGKWVMEMVFGVAAMHVGVVISRSVKKKKKLGLFIQSTTEMVVKLLHSLIFQDYNQSEWRSV